MQEILKHLEAAVVECSARIAGCVKTKKEYEAKFNDLRDLELKLREQGEEIGKRELKTKQIGNVMDYSADVDARAKKVKEEEVALAPKLQAHEVAVKDFNKRMEMEKSEIARGKSANQKQADALIKERNAFDAKVKAASAMAAATK